MAEANKELLNKYLLDESLRGHTNQGFTGLKNRITKLIKYIEDNDLKAERIGIKEALGFQGYLIETGRNDGTKYSNRTIQAYITTAVSFYNYLKRSNLVSTNPFLDIRRVREEYKLPKNILRENKMQKLLKELVNYDKETGLKNRISKYRVHIISELMYSSGIRISEAAKLKVTDIDFIRGIVRVREGKGGISRIAFLNEYAQKVLMLYVNEMRDLIFNEWNKRNDTLFGIKESCFEKAVNKELRKAGKKLNLGTFTSHGFRHALGFHLLRAGCDIRKIQEILGHKSLKNTEIYTKVEKEDLRDVLDQYHPRSFNKGLNHENTELQLCRSGV
jgi:integrase/recombinase XerD